MCVVWLTLFIIFLASQSAHMQKKRGAKYEVIYDFPLSQVISAKEKQEHQKEREMEKQVTFIHTTRR